MIIVIIKQFYQIEMLCQTSYILELDLSETAATAVAVQALPMKHRFITGIAAANTAINF